MKKLLTILVILCIMLTACNNKEEINLPQISDESINNAIEAIHLMDDVNDAAINIKDDRIIIAVITNQITKEQAKEIGSDAVNVLKVKSQNDIYDYYDVEVLVGLNKDNIIAHGVKVTVAKKITW